MSKFLKFIVNVFLVFAILTAAAILVPPLLGVTTTIVDTPSMKTNLPFGSITYSTDISVNALKSGDEVLKENNTSTYAYVIQNTDAVDGTYVVRDVYDTDAQDEEIILRNRVSKVAVIVPYIGYLIIAMHSIEGIIIVALVVVLMIILFILSELWKSDDDDDEDEEDEQPENVIELDRNEEKSSVNKANMAADGTPLPVNEVVYAEDVPEIRPDIEMPRTQHEVPEEPFEDIKEETGDDSVLFEDDSFDFDGDDFEIDGEDDLFDEDDEDVEEEPENESVDAVHINIEGSAAQPKTAEEPKTAKEAVGANDAVSVEELTLEKETVAPEKPAAEEKTFEEPAKTEEPTEETEIVETAVENVDKDKEKAEAKPADVDFSDAILAATAEVEEQELQRQRAESISLPADATQVIETEAVKKAEKRIPEIHMEHFIPVERPSFDELLEQIKAAGGEPEIKKPQNSDVTLVDYSKLL